MEGFESEGKDFELELLWDREPVKVLEDKGDLIPLTYSLFHYMSGFLDDVYLSVTKSAFQQALSRLLLQV